MFEIKSILNLVEYSLHNLSLSVVGIQFISLMVKVSMFHFLFHFVTKLFANFYGYRR